MQYVYMRGVGRGGRDTFFSKGQYTARDLVSLLIAYGTTGASFVPRQRGVYIVTMPGVMLGHIEKVEFFFSVFDEIHTFPV